MPTITEGVEFDTIAREWRCKWSDKKCLAQVQQALDAVKGELKGLKGLKSVQRVVCGGCLDFKVIIALSAGDYGAWEEGGKFAPEAKFLEAIGKIEGVTKIETQTFTLMPVDI